MGPPRFALLSICLCLAVALVRSQGTPSEPALDDVSLDEEKPCTEGQTVNHGCDEVCSCVKGGLECMPRCTGPLVKSSIGSQDPNCFLKKEDECCSTLICSHATTMSDSADHCSHNNQTYKLGEVFNVGCEAVCQCAAGGRVDCTSRCPPLNNTNSDSDRCLTAPDKKDPCCMILYCDVNESDDLGTDEEEEEDHELNLVSAIPANNSAIILNFESSLVPDEIQAEISEDKNTWSKAKTFGHVVQGLAPGKTYYFRVVSHAGTSNIVSSTLPNISTNSTFCEYKGKKYDKGVEFHDGCMAYCLCAEDGVECAPFKCPTYFGLDVLDPQCLKWETQPPNFKPEPPHCCPDSVVCVNNGSCSFKGEMFENWADIPTKLSGCDMKCYCQAGNVTCSPRCPPVPATPPQDIHCALDAVPIVTHPPDDNCCLHWMCPSNNGLDSNLTQPTTNKTLLNRGNNTVPTIPFLGPFNPDFIENKLLHLDNALSVTNHSKQVVSTNKNNSFPEHSDIETLDMNHSKIKTNTSHNDTAKSNSLNYTFEESKPHNNADPTYQKGGKNSSEFMQDNSKEVFHNKEHSNLKYEVPFFNIKDNSKHNNIPIGIINPDNLPSEYEEPQNNPSIQSHKLKPNFIEYLLEHRQQNGFQNQNFKKNLEPHSQKPLTIPSSNFDSIRHQNPLILAPNNVDSIGQQNQGPFNRFPNNIESVGQQNQNPLNHIESVRQQTPPRPFQFNNLPQNVHLGGKHLEINKNVPIPSNYREFGLYPQQKPESPPHYVTLFNGLPQDVFHPSKTFVHNPQLNSQYVSPEELYLVENKDQPITQQNQHPYLTATNLPSHSNDANIQNHSPVGLKLEDIIDDIKRHEATNSPSSDVHVLLIPSHPQNFAQGVSQPPSPGFPNHPSQEKNAITVHTVEAIDENTVRLVFSVPMILVGLHGRVELRYTADNKNSDPSTWEQQVLAPPDDLIATPELEFKLENLQPDTEYKIKITVVMRDLQNTPASQILTVKTPPASQPLPPIIPVDPELHVISVNSSSATVSWRKFTEKELQFIDGVQLRYKEIEGKVYQATPLIHRAVTSYTIEDLKPESQYEVGIFLIPFPGQTTELQSQKTVHLQTAIENDPYKFELILDVHHIKSSSVEVTWSGVPYPEDKYVNIFRAIYQCEGGREDMNAFKVAKRDSPAGTLIQGLKPDTRYRLWIEAYLTNGKIKKSNVKDFITKKGTGATTSPDQGKLKSASLAEGNDYYGPLVGVSILAAIAIVAAAGLLVVLARKHGHNKAPITTALQRKSLPHTAAYDNPSYKSCEGESANGRRNAPSFEEP